MNFNQGRWTFQTFILNCSTKSKVFPTTTPCNCFLVFLRFLTGYFCILKEEGKYVTLERSQKCGIMIIIIQKQFFCYREKNERSDTIRSLLENAPKDRRDCHYSYQSLLLSRFFWIQLYLTTLLDIYKGNFFFYLLFSIKYNGHARVAEASF